jgi:hypothetical protein
MASVWLRNGAVERLDLSVYARLSFRDRVLCFRGFGLWKAKLSDRRLQIKEMTRKLGRLRPPSR